jgi:serine/threonine protein kinase
MGRPFEVLIDERTSMNTFYLTEVTKVEPSLGRGAFGEVWEVKCRGATYAAKLVYQTTAEDLRNAYYYAGSTDGGFNNVHDFIIHEARMHSRLDHDCIVPFRGSILDSEGNFCGILMDKMDQSLAKMLEDNEASPKRLDDWMLPAAHILLQVAAALNYLSMQSVNGEIIIHGDLKPANVLLTPSSPPKVKLADFGLTRYRDEARRGGTVSYMAPEVRNGGLCSAKSDIYSFGVMILTFAFREGEMPDGEYDANILPDKSSIMKKLKSAQSQASVSLLNSCSRNK